MIVRSSGAVDSKSPVRHGRPTRTLVAAALIAVAWAFQPSGAAAQGPPELPPVAVGPPVTIEGELDVIVEDDDDEKGRVHHFVETANGRVKLRFQENDVPDLHTGSRVRVSGNLADGTVTTTTTSVTTIKASPSRTLGTQKVLVILFNFSNNPTQPYSASTVNAVNDQVKNFYLENSYGQTFMNFTVAGWYTIAATNSTCDYYTWATQAEAKATNAGFSLTAYDRRVFAFPQASSCSWWGMGNLSGPRSWVNGSYALRVVAHEQGHNFGNNHSHSMPCSSTGCTTVEYGSDRDVLGKSGVVGHMNAFQKERLGWLNYGVSPVAQTVTSSNDYWIDNYEMIGGNTKALKIWNSTTSSFYYIESRAKVGFDGGVAGGVTLHRGQPTTGSTNYQVDMDTTTTTWDSTLDVMQTFTDASIGLSVQTLSSSVDGAMVRIVLGGSATTCTKAAPSVALSLSATLKYTVTVTNRNGSSCPAATFNATASVPSGWSAAFSTASLPIASGASASTALTLTAPAGTVGTFTVGANAVDATGGAIGSATTTLSLTSTATAPSSLDVTTSATLATQTRADNTATITTGVMAGGVAVPGAAVTVVVTNPQGKSFTYGATTAADGRAIVKHSIRKNHPGTYQVQATATANGETSSATTTFRIP